MPCKVVVGGFWGDEGKGKIISYLALRDKVDIGVRGGVGPNAGHTVQFEGKTYKLRMVPSIFINEKARLLIGAGVLVNPKIFLPFSLMTLAISIVSRGYLGNAIIIAKSSSVISIN